MTNLSFVTVHENRMLCSIQDDTEGLDHGGGLNSYNVFVGGDGNDFLVYSIFLHEFHILGREGLRNEGTLWKRQ